MWLGGVGEGRGRRDDQQVVISQLSILLLAVYSESSSGALIDKGQPSLFFVSIYNNSHVSAK